MSSKKKDERTGKKGIAVRTVLIAEFPNRRGSRQRNLGIEAVSRGGSATPSLFQVFTVNSSRDETVSRTTRGRWALRKRLNSSSRPLRYAKSLCTCVKYFLLAHLLAQLLPSHLLSSN